MGGNGMMGLWGLGGTTGGGASFAWGLLILMLILVLAFVCVTWEDAVV